MRNQLDGSVEYDEAPMWGKDCVLRNDCYKGDEATLLEPGCNFGPATEDTLPVSEAWEEWKGEDRQE
jgi:hypothetical protein